MYEYEFLMYMVRFFIHLIVHMANMAHICTKRVIYPTAFYLYVQFSSVMGFRIATQQKQSYAGYAAIAHQLWRAEEPV